MNNFGVASTSKLIKQSPILNWLQQLSINEIKTIIQIKNPQSKLIVEKLIRNSKYKKQQVLKIGFFEPSKNDFYYRTEFRYKKDKQKKKIVSQQLYQNLTISRRDECALNISKDYLETGKLKDAMMTLSDGENQSLWFRRKDCHSFAEWVTYLFEIEIADAFNKKKVCKLNTYNFITEFTMEQIEAELKKAIIAVLSKNQKTLPNLNDQVLKQKTQQEKKYMFGKCWDRIQAEGRFVICEYTWLEEDREGQFAHIMDEMYLSIYARFHDYLIEQQIKDIEKFETDLNKNVNKKKKKKNKKKGPETKEEKEEKGEDSDFDDLTTNEQKIKQEQKVQITSSIKPSIQPIKQQQKPQIKMQERQKQNEEILSEKNNQSKVDTNSKKSDKSEVKTSNKESNDSHQQKSSEQAKKSRKKSQKKKQKLQSFISSLKEQKSDSYTDSTCKIESISQNKVEQSDEKSMGKEQERHTTKTKQYEQYYAHDKTSQMSQESELSADCLKFKPKSKSLSKQSIVGVSMKKIDRKIQEENKKQKQIESVMGAALQSHAKYLIEESQKFQQTRKAAVDLIREFLHKQELKCKWELVMFGSCEVGYALKQSDVDLVLRIEDQKAYSLKQMEEDLKCWPWVLDFRYIYFADLSIIKMKINLYEAKRLSNRLLKKLDKCITQGEDILQYQEQFIVKMDISMCGLKEQYSGTVGTNNLRFLFYENEPLKKIVFILKDLLHRKKLNETYYGGINSYTLALMVYGVIKKKELELTRSTKVENEYVLKKKKDYLESLKSNLYMAFCEITHFLRDFIPFQTLINPLEEKIEAEKKSPLNIVDPFSKKLLRTNASRIDDIIDEFLRFREFLEERKQEIKGLYLEGNKKIKNEVEKKIAQYMSELQPVLEVRKSMNYDENDRV